LHLSGNFVLRLATPLALLFASSSWLLPRTTRNVRDYGYEVERRRMPAVADAHQAAYDQSGVLWRRLQGSTGAALRTVDANVVKGTHKFEQLSGIHVGDVFRERSSTVEDAKEGSREAGVRTRRM
jgi:hypothetical protein